MRKPKFNPENVYVYRSPALVNGMQKEPGDLATIEDLGERRLRQYYRQNRVHEKGRHPVKYWQFTEPEVTEPEVKTEKEEVSKDGPKKPKKSGRLRQTGGPASGGRKKGAKKGDN